MSTFQVTDASPIRRGLARSLTLPSHGAARRRLSASDRLSQLEASLADLSSWLQRSLQDGIDEVNAEIQQRHEATVANQTLELREILRGALEVEQAQICKQLEDLKHGLIQNVERRAWLFQPERYKGHRIVQEMRMAGGEFPQQQIFRRKISHETAQSHALRTLGQPEARGQRADGQRTMADPLAQHLAQIRPLSPDGWQGSKQEPRPQSKPKPPGELPPGLPQGLVHPGDGDLPVPQDMLDVQASLSHMLPGSMPEEEDKQMPAPTPTYQSSEEPEKRTDRKSAGSDETSAGGSPTRRSIASAVSTMISKSSADSGKSQQKNKSQNRDLPFATETTRKSRFEVRKAKSMATGDTDDEDEEPFGYCWVVEEIVAHPAFESLFACLILVNSVIMALQVQYRGIQWGYELGYPGSIQSAESAWPLAVQTFYIIEWGFAALFTFELLMRLVAKGVNSIRDHWLIFDTVTVVFWFVDTLGNTTLPFPPMLLRLARLVRLLRLLRLVRKIQTFDSLYIMTTSIKHSFSALLWSTLLLIVVQMMIALFLNEMLETFVLDPNQPIGQRHEVYQYYGSFTRAMLSMFELTLANWIVPARVLSENVSEWYTLFSLSHQLIIGFAVVRVITGVFLHETFKVASTDDTIMVSEKERAIKLHTAKMNLLFETADESGDGLLQKDEFMAVVQQPAVKTWLAAMELDVGDADAVFKLVDIHNEGEFNAEQMVTRVAKLKGTAKSFEMSLCLKEMREARQKIDSLAQRALTRSASSRKGTHQAASLNTHHEELAVESHTESPAQTPTLVRPAKADHWRTEETTEGGEISASPTVQLEAAGKPPVREVSYDDDAGAPVKRVSTKKSTLTRSGSVMIPGMKKEGNPNDRGIVHRIVTSPTFEMAFAFLILANSLIMAFEAQYHGLQTGFEIGYARIDQPAAQSLPHALETFKVLEMIFGILFTTELVLKLIGLKVDFFKDYWNTFDSLIVLFWLVGALGAASLPLDPMLLRLARLVRLLRLLRLVRTMKGFDSLYLMVTSIRGSISALMWSAVLLLVVQMMIALLLNEMLETYIMDPTKEDSKRHEVYQYFGTFSRAMLTMFEITLANWAPVCRVLAENVSEYFVLFSLMHKFVIGFAVLMVITGVFIQETFKVASTDDTIMTMQRNRAIKVHRQKMELLFEVADPEGNGYLTRDQFKAVLDQKVVRTWLAAMELNVEDADLLFDLVSCDGHLTLDGLARGVAKLKGQARSFDLHMMMHEQKQLMKQVQDLARLVDEAGTIDLTEVKQQGPDSAEGSSKTGEWTGWISSACSSVLSMQAAMM